MFKPPPKGSTTALEKPQRPNTPTLKRLAPNRPRSPSVTEDELSSLLDIYDAQEGDTTTHPLHFKDPPPTKTRKAHSFFSAPSGIRNVVLEPLSDRKDEAAPKKKTKKKTKKKKKPSKKTEQPSAHTLSR